MSRQYLQIGLVSDTNGDEFLNMLNKRIIEFQNPAKGFFAEVQFQANASQAIALVLQYKEV